MNRNARFILNIVIVIVVIGLLAGGVYFLTQPEEQSDLSDVYTDDDRIKIFSYSTEELVGADVTNQYGSYSLSRTGSVWTMAGFEDITLNANALDTLVLTFQNVTSESRIEEDPADLSVYGLSQPAATLALTTKSGGKTFYIGNETPDGTGSYFNTDSSGDVYIMESYKVDVINLTAKNYVQIAAGIADSDIIGVRIEGGGSILGLEMQATGPKYQYGLLSYWDITEPRKQSASNSDVSEKLLIPISEIENGVSGVLEITDENLAMTGLDDPEYTVTVTTASKYITYEISAPSQEYRYLRRSDVNYLMRVDADDCAFVYTQPYNVAEKMLALIDIDMVREVNIEHQGKTYGLTILNGTGENAAFYYKNMQVDTDTYRTFYSHIVALPVSGEITEAPARDNIIGSIEYVLNSGDSLKLEFAPYNERNYAVFVNGEGLYTVAKKGIDSIFEEVIETFK